MIASISTILRPDALLSGAFTLVYLLTAIYSAVLPQGGKRWWALAAVLAGLVLAALQIQSDVLRMVLLDLAALAAVALVWVQPDPRAAKAARTTLALLLAGIALTAAGMALAGLFGGEAAQPAFPLDRWAIGLLVVGFSLKLALVPFYFWLPGVACCSSPMTTALIVGTLDIAEFGELLRLREAAPWVFTGAYGIWIALALLSMFGGALLALAQRDVKRMLAFSTIDDMGYLLLGVLFGSTIGLTGALLGAVSHSLFKVMMFGAVGVAENRLGHAVTQEDRGLAGRFPLSGATFIIGALGILGVPPLFGFLGRWRLYLAGTQAGGAALGIAMVLATALALFYYVRAIHRVWLGQPNGEAAPKGEPRMAAGVLVLLALIALALGIFPALILQA